MEMEWSEDYMLKTLEGGEGLVSKSMIREDRAWDWIEDFDELFHARWNNQVSMRLLGILPLSFCVSP